jgi:hypothetical protein
MATTMQSIIEEWFHAAAERLGARLLVHKDYANTGKMALIDKKSLEPGAWVNFTFSRDTAGFKTINRQAFATGNDVIVANYNGTGKRTVEETLVIVLDYMTNN